jgi:hypothetical protein
MIRALAATALGGILLIGTRGAHRSGDETDYTLRDQMVLEAAKSGYFMAVACDRDARVPFDSIKVVVFVDSETVHPRGLDPMTRAHFSEPNGVRAFSSPTGPYVVLSGPDRDNPFVWGHEYLHVFENDTTPETYHKKHRECGL